MNQTIKKLSRTDIPWRRSSSRFGCSTQSQPVADKIDTCSSGIPVAAPKQRSIRGKSSRNRPEFFFNSDSNKPVKGGGIVFYCIHEGEVYLLFQYNKICKWFEDFGGKTFTSDNDIFDTAAREADEESNNFFRRETMLPLIKNTQHFYHQTGKYCFFYIQINVMDPEMFGKREIFEDKQRTVVWVSLKNIRNHKLHPRLEKSGWDLYMNRGIVLAGSRQYQKRRNFQRVSQNSHTLDLSSYKRSRMINTCVEPTPPLESESIPHFTRESRLDLCSQRTWS
ncbi:MAG: hypothetical protein JKX76_00795 [Colwellia sp.]|nr:hypothetical protein [Colwellia sp.]